MVRGSPLELSTVYAADRQAWREWLQRNHASEPDGVWLIFYKPHTGKASIPYDHSVEEALCFGWVDSLIRRLDDDRYARKFTPRKPDSAWSESNRKRVERMIAQGRMTETGLERVREARASGRWSQDARPVVDLTPAPEFLAALTDAPDAATHYASLTEAQRRQYLTWINIAKRPETRSRRIAEAIVMLARGEKLGMK